MKNLISIFLFLSAPLISVAQTQADYEMVMSKFMKFYNEGQADSMKKLFGYKAEWTPPIMQQLTQVYGEMLSVKYIGTYKKNGPVIFKTVFGRAKHPYATPIELYKHKNIVRKFGFNDTNPEAQKLIKDQ